MASGEAMQIGDQETLLRELLSQMAKLQKDVEEMKLNADGGQPQHMDVESTEEVERDEDAEEPPTWGMLLQPPQVVPKTAEAVSLSLLLAGPPPLGHLKKAEENIKQYTSIPVTVPPRANRIDRSLFVAQKKMENTMHLITHHFETGDKTALAMAAAVSRSAWEDINQQRRALLVGKQVQVLDKRKDDERPRLLSEAEDQRMARTSRPNFKQGKGQQRFTKPNWAPNASSSSGGFVRSRSSSNSRTEPGGRGKGKGKGSMAAEQK